MNDISIIYINYITNVGHEDFNVLIPNFLCKISRYSKCIFPLLESFWAMRTFLGNKLKYHIFLLKYDIFIILAHDENLNIGVSCFLHMLLNRFKHIFLLLESFSTLF